MFESFRVMQMIITNDLKSAFIPEIINHLHGCKH